MSKCDELGLDESKVNVLISYAHWDKGLTQNSAFKDKKINLFIDSGAFTNFTSGTDKIKVDDYCHFLTEHKDLVWRYINLDKIGDAKESEANYQEMQSRGFKPVPVFTRDGLGNSSQRKKDLFEMCQTTDFLCLGGVAGGLHRTENQKYVTGCSHFLKKQKMPYHILGCGSPSIIKATRPYSCDSSSYCVGNKFGSMSLFFNGKFYAVNRKTIGSKKKVPTYVLRKYGMTDRHRKSSNLFEVQAYDFRMDRGILSYIYFQRYIREKFNANYFLAMSPAHMPHLERALSYGI